MKRSYLEISLILLSGFLLLPGAAYAGEPVPEPATEPATESATESPTETAAGDASDVAAEQQEMDIAEFKAIYRLKRGGFEVAEAVMEVRRMQEDIYRYTSHSEALGLLSVFVSDEIDEVSVFRVTGDDVRPLSYTYRHKGSSKNRDEDITYDWTAGIAETNYRGEEGEIELEAGAVDRFLLPVVIGTRNDLASFNEEVPIIDNGKVRYWKLAATSQEKLKTPAGTFETIRIERVDEDIDKELRFWLAPELNYLPVRIEQIKRNEEPLRLTIQSLKQ